MKFGKILLPLVLLGLAACGTPASSETESTPDSQGASTSQTGGTSVGESVGVSENGTTAGLPLTGDFTQSAIPDGWTYYSGGFDPAYYNTIPGLKLAHLATKVTSPTFGAVNAVTVTLNIPALNANQKTAGTDPNILTAYGYNAAGTIVNQAGLTSVIVGANTINLAGTGIVKVEVEFTNYPVVSGVAQNINLASVKLA